MCLEIRMREYSKCGGKYDSEARMTSSFTKPDVYWACEDVALGEITGRLQQDMPQAHPMFNNK